MPVVEWLRVNDEMRRHIAAKNFEGLIAEPSLARVGDELVRAGITDEREMGRVLGWPLLANEEKVQR